LAERGQFRIDPMVVRTGDPFGLFESVATVGPGAGVLVYPPVEQLPGWRLPPGQIEGATVHQEPGSHLTPLVTSVRPYTPGDAFNRIHWRSSARHQDLQVKEFDIERSADLWIFLDLDRAHHSGAGQQATIETAVRVAAALSAHALADGRGVGMEAIGLRRAVIADDRGARQQQKIMGLLAVAQAEGSAPLAEMLVEGVTRLRRGTLPLVVTPSLDRSWVKPLATLGGAGVTPVACVLDPLAHAGASLAANGESPLSPSEREPFEREMRALQHALGEHDVDTHVIVPDVPLGEQIVAAREARDARVPVGGR
jgi:uncharacterized protein (DUF58 family)